MTSIIVDGSTRKFGLIGNPVHHSLSPNMQSLAFQAVGLNAVYLPFPLTETQLPELLNAFRLLGIEGFNVTVPFKSKIIPYLDHISTEAKALQSVNTVQFKNNTWHGYSTDGAGFIRAGKDAGIKFQSKKVLLIGAGGSAAAVSFALLKEGVDDLHILNRTLGKAEQLVQLLQAHFPHRRYNTEPVNKNLKFDLLVNTTSVGMNEDRSPVEKSIVKNCNFVFDIVYAPLKTKLMTIADQYNIQNINGLNMLLYQGVEAFEIWTQLPAPIKKMRETLFKSFI